MNKSSLGAALIALSLLFSAGLASAATPVAPDIKGAATATGESVKTGATNGAKGVVADAKTAAKAKLVDINSASEAELKAIPGIGDAYAAKIVAGRPYANKTQLKSRNILPTPAYEKVKDLIIAKQPKK